MTQFEEDTATSSGYSLDCYVFLSPTLHYTEIASELQWLEHPNQDASVHLLLCWFISKRPVRSCGLD